MFAILATTAVVLTAVSFFTFRFTKIALEQSIMSHQLEIARQTMNNIDRLLSERCTNIQTLAGESSFKNLLVNKDSPWVKRIQDEALKRQEALSVLTGPWDILMVIDEQANILLSSDDKEVGMSVKENRENQMAYEAALREEFYYSDAMISKKTGRPTIIFAAPVRNTAVTKQPVI